MITVQDLKNIQWGLTVVLQHNEKALQHSNKTNSEIKSVIKYLENKIEEEEGAK